MTLAFRTKEGRQAVLEAYEKFIKGIRFPYEEINVDTRWGKAFVIAAGRRDSPNLILLHGSAMNSAMWFRDMEKYTEHFRVYAVDLQGEPGKSDPKQLPFSGPDFSDWLYDVYRGLGIQQADIVGISLGAWLAQKFAIARPTMVSKMVLLSPAGIGRQRKSFALKALFYMLFGSKGIERLYRKVNGSKDIPRIILDYQMLIGKHFNYRREEIPLFTDDELAQTKAYPMVIVGKKDVMFFSMETAERYQRLVPHARVVVLEEDGHSLVMLTDQILDFLLE